MSCGASVAFSCWNLVAGVLVAEGCSVVHEAQPRIPGHSRERQLWSHDQTTAFHARGRVSIVLRWQAGDGHPERQAQVQGVGGMCSARNGVSLVESRYDDTVEGQLNQFAAATCCEPASAAQQVLRAESCSERRPLLAVEIAAEMCWRVQ
ncbi:hypothetical protein NA57DRAFT_52292 [Rhizodiscina lignyota]|uniref:Secreted protein n=1 Tax=Rhizodiscina lignyota TaxID=1504668 RepID=A0A9P4IMM5_9PEZI|nr:hypothetical protein NA57DRAFT_52292 [Rhizodiscina lignyota]